MIYFVALKLLIFFAVVTSTANRDDRDRGRGCGLAVEIWTAILPLVKILFFNFGLFQQVFDKLKLSKSSIEIL